MLLTHDEWTHIKLDGADKELELPVQTDGAEAEALLKAGLRKATPEEIQAYEGQR